MPTIVSLAPYKLVEIVDALKQAPADTEYTFASDYDDLFRIKTRRFDSSWDAYLATETAYEGESEE